MSKKQAIAFFEEISKNKQLAQEVKKVVEGNNSDEAKAKELISLAQRYNFNFTPEEATAAQGELKKPLSPEEMLEVSGGKLNLKSSLLALTLLAGLGVGSATLTNMDASAMKRTNYSSSSRSSGKRGKTDSKTLENLNVNSQPTPQPVDAITPEQGETPPSNDQGSAQSDSQQTTRRTPHSRPRTTSGEGRHAPRTPREEKKAQASKEHDKKAAARFDDINGCSARQVKWARWVSGSGATPSADWPAAPTANLDAENGVCRFCGGTLSTRGKKALDVKCANAGCIYNWVFHSTGDANLKGKQRGQINKGHYVRWALLPALILDSRLPTIGHGPNQLHRPAAIITPAEAWAVWQLIVGHQNGWVDVTNMMVNHGVADDVIIEVLGLLKESYANLAHGNEHLRESVGSEVQELVNGHDNGWRDIQAMMDQRGYDATAVDTAIGRMKHAYNMLTNEQLTAVGIDPAAVARTPKAALDAIESAHQRFEESMQQLAAEKEQARQQREAEKEAARQQREAEKEAARQQREAEKEAARQQREAEKEAARQQREEANQQLIKKLQREEALSDDEKKALAKTVAKAGLVQCRCRNANDDKGCGSNNISFVQFRSGNFCFKCNECKARNGGRKGTFFTLTPDDLLDMLPAAAPGNMPRGMADAEQDEPPMQMMQELQSVNETHHNTNQMNANNNNNLNNLNNNNVDYDDSYSEDMDFDEGVFKLIQDLDNENDDENKSPREEKEQPEDYENQERYVPGPDEMGYQEPPQQMQMMNQNEFNFNFGGQDMNQFYTAQPTQQIFVPNLFNANNEHSFHIQHIPVFQMDINQNNTQQQHGQLDLVMQQNAQVDQNQQPVTYQPGLNFDPTQILQQIPDQNFQFDPVGKCVNALNVDTQELTQCNNLLLELISSGQSGNADQLVAVVAAAWPIVNRVFERELQDQANQFILNALGADERYLTAAQAFSEQLEIFNNVLETIQKAGQ